MLKTKIIGAAGIEMGYC